MIVVFDSSVLIDLFNPKLTGDLRETLDDLVSNLKRDRSKILIPAPALTELMVRADKARESYYQILSKSNVFQIAPFDAKAAMECALLLEDALSKPSRKSVTNTKFKFDWQIAAIAASRSADIIFSEDADLERCATRIMMRFQRPSTLPLPYSAKQRKLDLESSQSTSTNPS